MNLRTDKGVARKIEPQSSAEVSHEMRAGGVVRARSKVARVKIVVETNTLRSNSCLKLPRGALANLGHPNSVEIPKNRAIRLIPCVKGLACLPGYFSAHAKLVFEKELIAANRKISAAIQGLDRKSVV